MASVDITIVINTLKLTTATDLITAGASNFIMHGTDVTVSVTNETGRNDASKNSQNEIEVKTNANHQGSLELKFTCSSATNSVVTNYRINGILFKRTDTAAGSDQTPSRVADIEGIGSTQATLKYNRTAAGLDYEFYLLIQHPTNGSFGLVDPKLVTRN
jgi:hypothetical protein